eukprot:TRINITY_DN1099_c0_g1_i1.p1 TRINITY_DN1099_c0_g1~~TRINITY_DN1099_c0_g1_i1.p1  ORF type:complete len:563 (+),score=124.38 TRINITY_DN1099_c0_g1_i1:206-1894(+)
MGSMSYERYQKDIALTIPSPRSLKDGSPLPTPSRVAPTTPSVRNPRLPAGGFSHPEHIPASPLPQNAAEAARQHEAQEAEVAVEPRKVFWDEAKGQVKLAAPIVGMNLVQMLLVLSSAAFVGHLGTLELASCQLATTLANATGHYVLIGMILGFETLGGRAFGAGQYTELGHMMLCCIILLTVVAALVSAIWTQAYPILLLLGQDPALAKMAARYLLFLVPSMFGHAWSAPLVVFLQSQGVTGPLAWCSALTLVLHVPANWYFIYYLDWKSDGAAIATSISYCVMFLILAAHVYFTKRYAPSLPRFAWNKTFRNWRPIVNLALPSTVMLCLEFWAFDILYILAGLLPDPYVVVSALSVAMNASWLASMSYIGLGAALSTRVSTELGSNSSTKARVAARVGLTAGAFLGVCVSVIILATARWVPLIFVGAEDTKVLRLSSQLMMVIATLAFSDAISQNAGGIMRGCGRQPLGATITLSSYYVIGLPTCAALAFGFKLGIWGLVGGQILGVTCQAAFLATAVAFTNWPRQAARALASVLETGRAEARPTANENEQAAEGDRLEI